MPHLSSQFAPLQRGFILLPQEVCQGSLPPRPCVWPGEWTMLIGAKAALSRLQPERKVILRAEVPGLPSGLSPPGSPGLTCCSKPVPPAPDDWPFRAGWHGNPIGWNG